MRWKIRLEFYEYLEKNVHEFSSTNCISPKIPSLSQIPWVCVRLRGQRQLPHHFHLIEDLFRFGEQLIAARRRPFLRHHRHHWVRSEESLERFFLLIYFFSAAQIRHRLLHSARDGESNAGRNRNVLLGQDAQTNRDQSAKDTPRGAGHRQWRFGDRHHRRPGVSASPNPNAWSYSIIIFYPQ